MLWYARSGFPSRPPVLTVRSYSRRKIAFAGSPFSYIAMRNLLTRGLRGLRPDLEYPMTFIVAP